MSRHGFISGPAKILRGAVPWYTKDASNFKLETQTKPVISGAHGTMRHNRTGRLVTFSHTPSGQLSTAIIAQLWPYASSMMGIDPFGATDVPLVAHGQDGDLHTMVASALTKMPDLHFSDENTAIGSAEFTGVLGLTKAPSDADAFYTVAASGGVYADATFTGESIKSQLYTGALAGITGLTEFFAMEGFKVQFQTKVDLKWAPGKGFVGGRLSDVSVMASFRPYGPTSQEVLDAINWTSELGTDANDDAVAFTITGQDASTIFTIPKATPVSAGFEFGGIALRQGEVGVVASRAFAAGVPSPLWTFVV